MNALLTTQIEMITSRQPKAVARRVLELHGDNAESEILRLLTPGPVRDVLLHLVATVREQDKDSRWNKQGLA